MKAKIAISAAVVVGIIILFLGFFHIIVDNFGI
jgi:hypothetical protein